MTKKKEKKKRGCKTKNTNFCPCSIRLNLIMRFSTYSHVEYRWSYNRNNIWVRRMQGVFWGFYFFPFTTIQLLEIGLLPIGDKFYNGYYPILVIFSCVQQITIKIWTFIYCTYNIMYVGMSLDGK